MNKISYVKTKYRAWIKYKSNKNWSLIKTTEIKNTWIVICLSCFNLSTKRIFLTILVFISGQLSLNRIIDSNHFRFLKGFANIGKYY